MESQSGQRIDVATASAGPGMLGRTTVAIRFSALLHSSGAIGATAIVVVAIGLIGIDAAVVTAAQDDIVVVPSSASLGSDLAESFPASIDGQPVEVESWSGTDWVTRFDPGLPEEAAAIVAFDTLAGAAGATPDDLEVATTSIDLGPDGEMTITAVRIPGSRAYDLVDAAADMLAPDIAEPSVGWDQVSGRWYAFFLDLSAPTLDPAVFYPAGDTVWVVRTKRQQVTGWWRPVKAVVAALPPQPDPVGPIVSLTQRVEVPELGITAAFPEDWVIDLLPSTPNAQDAARWVRRLGVDAAYVVAWRAEGPQSPRLSGPPMCQLALFGPTRQTPGELADLIRRRSTSLVERSSLRDEPRDGLLRARMYPGADIGSSSGFFESFVFGDRDMVGYLTCWSKDPPGDRGLAIAESVEFLPT